MSMPQSLGYASIAGMPEVTGLYTLLMPLLGFATFGSSRFLVVAADSATAAILAGGISDLASGNNARYLALASLVALLTALLLLLARTFKVGFLADFLSQTVLVGFLTGVGVQIGIAVLPKMLGLNATSHRTVGQLIAVLSNFPQIHLPSLALSILVVAGVFVLHRYVPRVPGPLVAVIGSVAASEAWNLAGRGFAVIGPVASGLPRLTMPDVAWKDVETLLPVAASCFVMIVTQSAATARVYALRHKQRLDENADLLGLAAANSLAAFSGTFVVNGSPTQTAVSETGGSGSQVTQLFAAAVVALVLLFFSQSLEFLPQCVLGSIVFIVAMRLMDFRGLRRIRRESPAEFALATMTAIVVVVVGVEQGIVLAMIVSLLQIGAYSYHPHTAVLVPAEGDIWRLTPPVPGAITEHGLVIYRFGALLFYANAGRFADEIRGLVGNDPSPIHWVIVDAGAITRVDYSAARVIQELQAELGRRNIVLVFARVDVELQADLDRHYLTEVIGRSRIFEKLHVAVESYRQIRAKDSTRGK